MTDKFTAEDKDKLLNAISVIELMAQNMEDQDPNPGNEWSFIEADAASLREIIEELEASE